MKLDRKRMTVLVNEWKNILKIDKQWDISFEIIDSPLNMSDDCEGAMACIDIDLDYFDAHIEFNSIDIEEKDLDYIILHELLHIIIEPIAMSNACGLGTKYRDVSTMLCESTIERLIPGYLALRGKTKSAKINKDAKKKKLCKVKHSKRQHKI